MTQMINDKLNIIEAKLDIIFMSLNNKQFITPRHQGLYIELTKEYVDIIKSS
jgi:hypothetical protein